MTGCVVGFLRIDILPPTSAELNNTLNKKKVFQILTEMPPNRHSWYSYYPQKIQSPNLKRIHSYNFGGQMLGSAFERTGLCASFFTKGNKKNTFLLTEVLIIFSTSHIETEKGNTNIFTISNQNWVSWSFGRPWKHWEALKCKIRMTNLVPAYLPVSPSEQHSPWGLDRVCIISCHVPGLAWHFPQEAPSNYLWSASRLSPLFLWGELCCVLRAKSFLALFLLLPSLLHQLNFLLLLKAGVLTMGRGSEGPWTHWKGLCWVHFFDESITSFQESSKNTCDPFVVFFFFFL